MWNTERGLHTGKISHNDNKYFDRWTIWISEFVNFYIISGSTEIQNI